VEKVFYITFKQDGRKVEEKAGRQYADNMTPAKAAAVRAERIEGKRKSRLELRQEAEERRQAEANRWTFSRLWEEYRRQRPMNKALATDDNRFKLHLAPVLGEKTPEEALTSDTDRLRVPAPKEAGSANRQARPGPPQADYPVRREEGALFGPGPPPTFNRNASGGQQAHRGPGRRRVGKPVDRH
jgi:hypothetical protein